MEPNEPLTEERAREIVREELAALITQPFVKAVTDTLTNVLMLGVPGLGTSDGA
jgi:hypothetical protein